MSRFLPPAYMCPLITGPLNGDGSFAEDDDIHLGMESFANPFRGSLHSRSIRVSSSTADSSGKLIFFPFTRPPLNNDTFWLLSSFLSY